MILSMCLAKLPRNRNPCVLAPLRPCIDATAFFRTNGALSRSLASSQGPEACGLASRSRKRRSIRASLPPPSVSARHPPGSGAGLDHLKPTHGALRIGVHLPGEVFRRWCKGRDGSVFQPSRRRFFAVQPPLSGSTFFPFTEAGISSRACRPRALAGRS